MPKTKTSGQGLTAKGRAAKRNSKKPGRRSAKSQIRRDTNGIRLLSVPKRIWYRPWTWRRHVPAPSRTPLPKARQLVSHAAVQLWRDRKLFGGITLIYGILNLLLVRGLSATSDLGSFKDIVSSIFKGAVGQVETAVTSFVYLISTSGGGSTPTSGTYQGLLLILASLAFIWALRQTSSQRKPRIRDSFYDGMYPLVPFLVVLFNIGLQLIPLAVSTYVYSVLVTNGIVVDAGEKLLAVLVCAIPVWWSMRMITASAFALYIVTLPDMTPLKALRSAKQLVYKRRLLIWRKFIMLPIVLLLVAVLIEIPLIFWLTPLAEWAFFIYSMIALAFVHSYMYNLYRSML